MPTIQNLLNGSNVSYETYDRKYNKIKTQNVKEYRKLNAKNLLTYPQFHGEFVDNRGGKVCV